MKKLKKITLWSLAIFAFLVAQSAFLLYLYQDEIKNSAISKLNGYLATEIQVGHISFSVFEHFPYVSITFPEVHIKEAVPGSREDLVAAGKISLLFNFWDLYSKNYRIRKLYVSDADIHIKTDSTGKDNYHFWKTGTGKEGEAFKLDVDEIILSKVRVTYADQAGAQFYDIMNRDVTMKGKFAAGAFQMALRGEMLVNRIQHQQTIYLHNKELWSEASLFIDTEKENYRFDELKLKLTEMTLVAKGEISRKDNQRYISLDAQGSEMTIQSFLSLLPNRYASYMKNYQSTGDFYLNVQVQGAMNQPSIVCTAGIRNGTVQVTHETLGKRTVKNVQMQVTYTNGKNQNAASSSLNIKEFSGVIEGNPLQANMNISNFDNPYLQLEILGQLKMEDVLPLIPTQKIKTAGGNVKINASFAGYIKDFNNSAGTERIRSEGTLDISNLHFTADRSDLEFKEFTGSFEFRNNDLRINSWSGKISESDFRINGYFRNLLAFVLLPDQQIEIDAQLFSNRINLDQLLSVSAGVSATSDTVYVLKISPKIIAHIKADIGRLNFERFTGENIRGSFHIVNQVFNSDYLSLDALKGQLYAKLRVDASSSDHIRMNVEANLKSVDIRRMFYEFKNFSQDVLVDKNLSGRLSASIQSEALFSKALQMDTRQLTATGNILIENGELISYEPMLALAKYIDVEELKSMRFSTIENKIDIRNRVITIPTMDIQSNALNLTLSGTHNFDNDIDYHLKILLSEIMRKRSKRFNNDEQFGEIEDDGSGKTTLFLRMYGNVSNPKFALDKNAIRQKIKSDLKQEGREVKDVLKTEFSSWFKKDQEFKEQVKEGAADWEKDIPGKRPATVNTKTPLDTSKKKTGFQKLKDKLKEPVPEEE
jgi:uncharacterized protein involved in outer membrane biogenesis